MTLAGIENCKLKIFNHREEIERYLEEERAGAETARSRLSAIKLHLDEDADAYALLRALRQRGLDVTS